jgi:pterin-4a-carbinolamine dehydratase
MVRAGTIVTLFLANRQRQLQTAAAFVSQASTALSRCEKRTYLHLQGDEADVKAMPTEPNDIEVADMMSAKRDVCVPCSRIDDSFILTPEQIQTALATLPTIPANLQLIMGASRGVSSSPGGAASEYAHVPLYLRRTFVAKNFQAALDCIRRMGDVAERVNHHPDFHLTEYRTVSVVIYTHKLMGVTLQDVRLARLFNEEVPIEYSPKWLKELGGS